MSAWRADGEAAPFSYVDLEQRIRPDHPLRAIRGLTDSALAALRDAAEVRLAK
jgi:hypothetical protein